MRVRILRAEDLRRALPMSQAISAMKEAFAQLSQGQAQVPLRSRVDLPRWEGVSLFMPAYLSETDDLAVKIVSVHPHNPESSLPTIHALVVALEAETGRPLALLEGASLTAIRTGAGSGAATDILARPEARTAAIFGSGVQARTQLEAVCTVRRIQRAWVYSLDLPGAQAFVEELAGHGPIPSDLMVARSPEDAVTQADIICTATTSSTPVFPGHALRPGTHINAIGSFTPTMQEVDATTVERSLLIVDSREAVLAETGDLLIPLQEGRISDDHIHAELGEIANGAVAGRTSADQITLYKSVGIAVQDAAAAGLALRRADELGLGQVVEL